VKKSQKRETGLNKNKGEIKRVDRRKYQIAILALGAILLSCISVQAEENGSKNHNLSSTVNFESLQRGTFFIEPFYEFSEFKSLEMESCKIKHKTYEGNSSYKFSHDDIALYNENFDTTSKHNVYGAKIGYVWDIGLSLYGSLGAIDFSHESWKSRGRSHEQSSDNPGYSVGLGVDYEKTIYKGLTGFVKGAYNYSRVTSIDMDSISGEDVHDAKFKTNTWDINLGLGHRFSRVHPYVGVGYTQTYQDLFHKEEIQTESDTGVIYYNTTEIDAEFKQNDFYGFTGVDIKINPTASMYVRSRFGDPFQVTVGLKFNLTGRSENDK